MCTRRQDGIVITNPAPTLGEFDPTEHEAAGETPTARRRRWLSRSSRRHASQEVGTGTQDLHMSTRGTGSYDCTVEEA